MTGNVLAERAEKALRIAEPHGKAEAYLATNELLSIRMANTRVIESKAIHDTGIGVRVLIGDGIGFSSTTDLTDRGLAKAVDDAVTMARHRKTGFIYDLPHPKKAKAAQIYDKATAELVDDVDSVTEYAHGLMDASAAASPRVAENSGIVNILRFNKVVMNSNGVDVDERGTGWSAFLTTTAQGNLEQREGMVTGSTIKVSDFDPERMGVESAKMAVESLGGKKIDEGDYELILLPSAAQCVVTELAGCTNPPTQESSIPLLRDRLGEQIASELFTLRMNPRRTGFSMVGAYDDEGVPTEELTLFDRGVYNASPYDSWYSQRYGLESTGHGFRSMSMLTGGTAYHGKMYHVEPSPVAACLEMESGGSSVEEMIESTRRGIMVGVIWYSRIMLPTRGDYNAIMRMGTMRVENGDVTGATQKFRLADNILSLARNMELIGEPEPLSHWHMPYGSMAPIKVSKAHCMPYSD
ncbi:TldD/PmbA family protein [Candidatus Bathyarchaeota archaeon]|nr:TldD/PmbA family protein [Candidatus Bathyarchaeota archaeon]